MISPYPIVRSGVPHVRLHRSSEDLSGQAWGDWEIFIRLGLFIPFQEGRVAAMPLLVAVQGGTGGCRGYGDEALAADGIDCAVMV